MLYLSGGEKKGGWSEVGSKTKEKFKWTRKEWKKHERRRDDMSKGGSKSGKKRERSENSGEVSKFKFRIIGGGVG